MSNFVKSVRKVWQGPKSWWLEAATLEKPDGTEVESGIIRHPGAVVLIPMLDDETVLMLHQYRLAVDQVILELPAGTRDWDEPWESCAQRELREETGYRAANFVSLGEIWPAPSFSDELLHLFLATDLTHDPLPADFDEEIEVVPMQLAELTTMALDGRMPDGKSCVSLLRAAHYLNNQSK